ncbi:MAG TPA: M48 family metallopeptidase [Candidatus Methylacidiphilales bacterium]|jgi:Zn-dependent protease with chaperone function|nr:M48 family metallopeptidase [Candidatus Methylacidiphilales bacterium]
MESQTGTLTLGNLVNPRENTYFYILLGVSIFIWVCIVISVVGIFIGVALAIIAWFTHGLLVARLRSESVLITPQQYPELHASFVESCQRLGMDKVPELYLLQHGGVLNAFATRHAGRNFVVLYSSFVETIGASSPMIKFLMGHELGHLRRKHLSKKVWLAPGMILPLIGEAYHRACEATCDRHGAYAANDLQASMLALTVLASGREAANVNTQYFADQYFTTRGFFVSWHELIINYPTLSQRVAQILGFADAKYAQRPGRNPLAYVCALFFSAKNILYIYLAVVAVSVLIALGDQVKAKAAEAAAGMQDDSSVDTNAPSAQPPASPDQSTPAQQAPASSAPASPAQTNAPSSSGGQ